MNKLRSREWIRTAVLALGVGLFASACGGSSSVTGPGSDSMGSASVSSEQPADRGQQEQGQTRLPGGNSAPGPVAE